MKNLLLYCRPGYENDCAAEIQAEALKRNIYGYVKSKANSGYLLYCCPQASDAEQLARSVGARALIFARQMLLVGEMIRDLPTDDRIRVLLEHAEAQQLPKGGELRVETADTDEARPLLKFCRKFTVPLRQALRKADKLLAKPLASRPVLHLFLLNSGCGFLGYSYAYNNSPFYMGIPRLKFPSQAPSRSTLKLDEAFKLFLPGDLEQERIRPGMQAVDLGACPGGWTYQLVRRGMYVHAVDNGAMQPELMATGQVKHYAADGFKFEPKRKEISWLVCDMIETPDRVAELMSDWLIKKWASETIFNLKLPMKQRFETVQSCLALIDERLGKAGVRYELTAKHLYHDRDEVTVYLRRLSHHQRWN